MFVPLSKNEASEGNHLMIVFKTCSSETFQGSGVFNSFNLLISCVFSYGQFFYTILEDV